MNKDIKKTVEFNLVEVIVIILVTGIVVSVASGLIVFKNYDKFLISNSSEKVSLDEFNEAYNHIVNSYVKDVDESGLIEAAIEGMYNYLEDEYSIFMDKDSSSSINEKLDGEYTGIGIEVITNAIDKTVIINKIFDNTPAKESGLKVGDQIIALDDVLLSEKENDYLSNTIKNSDKKSFKIKYLRNEKEYDIVINRGNIVIESVISKEYDNVGYIKIDSFSANTSSQVKGKISEFSSSVDSIVLDLRDNTGGYLSSAYEIADYFVNKGTVIYQLKDKNGKISKYTAKSGKLKDFKNISIIINKYSASASEVLTLALKDNLNATIVGVKSYGKGTVQERSILSSGASVKYTTSYWLGPNGECIDDIGISPDIEENDSTKQLERAISLFKK